MIITKKLRSLESDIDFFLLYMERNKKNNIRFDSLDTLEE